MPHMKSQLKLNQHVWLVGLPGSGYESIGKTLQNGILVDNQGFRYDHECPYTWFQPLDRWWYQVTDPEAPAKVWCGWGDNFKQLSILPWRLIIVLDISAPVLAARQLQFRKLHGIDDSMTQTIRAQLNGQIGNDKLNDFLRWWDIYTKDVRSTKVLKVSVERPLSEVCGHIQRELGRIGL